jgi:hypothetical protein
MNNSSDNSNSDDGEEHGELVWNEFDWERYLRQRDEAVTAYRRCYDEAADSSDRLDEVARQLGWEATLDGDIDGDDEDDEDFDDDLDPYTLHRNPVYVATRALFAGVTEHVQTAALVANGIEAARALALLRTLHEAEMSVVLGVQSLDLGDSALGISQLKRALGLLNVSMSKLPDTAAADGETAVSSTEQLRRQALPRLFDLREICLRVIRECRQELQHPQDDEGQP